MNKMQKEYWYRVRYESDMLSYPIDSEDSCVYMIPYSFFIVFMCVLILYRFHHRHRVDGGTIRYENISDLCESDIVETVSQSTTNYCT